MWSGNYWCVNLLDRSLGFASEEAVDHTAFLVISSGRFLRVFCPGKFTNDVPLTSFVGVSWTRLRSVSTPRNYSAGIVFCPFGSWRDLVWATGFLSFTKRIHRSTLLGLRQCRCSRWGSDRGREGARPALGKKRGQAHLFVVWLSGAGALVSSQSRRRSNGYER